MLRGRLRPGLHRLLPAPDAARVCRTRRTSTRCSRTCWRASPCTWSPGPGPKRSPGPSTSAPRAANFFVTGSSIEETVTGRVFTEDVREPDQQLLLLPDHRARRQGTAPLLPEVDGNDPSTGSRPYYTQSEQRPGRAFRLGGDRYALLAAQPDFDEEWLEPSTTGNRSRTIERREETKLLETRRFRFHCGCTLDRILPVLGSWRDKPDELFDGSDQITIQCPRCAANYTVTRDMI